MKWILMLIPYALIIGGNIGVLVYVLTSISKIKKQQQEILGKLKAYSAKLKDQVVAKDEKLQRVGYKEYMK